jgi:hypothetical protein
MCIQQVSPLWDPFCWAITVITTEEEYKVQEVLASKLVWGKLLYW